MIKSWIDNLVDSFGKQHVFNAQNRYLMHHKVTFLRLVINENAVSVRIKYIINLLAGEKNNPIMITHLCASKT